MSDLSKDKTFFREMLIMSRFDIKRACESGSVRVHLGGELRQPGWIIINPKSGPDVDIRGDHRRLALFPPESVSTIYASHVVEHLNPRTELEAAMRLFERVLKPGGRLLISVPDLLILCRIYADLSIPERDRRMAMMMMFGGHVDEFDIHHIGFDESYLRQILKLAGFLNVERVDKFGLFDDASTITLCGKSISLNVIAHKPY
jgi:predicted SAM-dependent methyltransferase